MTGTLRGCVHPTRSGTATVSRLEILSGGFRAAVANTRLRARALLRKNAAYGGATDI
jgi:hypothetical protein